MPVAKTKMEQGFDPDAKPNFAYAPQKPQADPTSYRTYEELDELLGGALFEEADGWYREVPYHIGADGVYYKDDKLVMETHWAKRLVSLTRAGAQESTRGGLEADWYDGYTWWRRGVKPEKDAHVEAAAADASRVTFEDAGPASVAAHQSLAAHRQAVKPVAPVVETKEK